MLTKSRGPARYTQFTTLSKGDSAAVSVVQHLGRDHLRVPVVMLVGDKVINPTGSQGPEFVPSSILSALGWNGRPVIPIHPGMVSANTPEVIDQMGFGCIFHAQVKNGSLGCEVYLDIARAKELKNGADSVVRNCQAGEMIEVSTGCFVTVRQETGVAPDGTPYEYIWESIVEPDHLAMGLDGATGACSVDSHGCGAPRMLTMPNNSKTTLFFLNSLASGLSDMDLRDLLRQSLLAATPGAKYLWPEAVYDTSVVYSVSYDSGPEKLFERSYTLSGSKVTVAEGTQEVVLKKTYEPKTKESRQMGEKDSKDNRKGLSAFAARLAKMVEWFRSNEDISDSDLRSKLSAALYSIEPGSPWVVDVFQSTSTVVYTCWIDNYEIWYQRTFNLDSATGDVTLNDDRQEVVRKDPATVYEVVQAATGTIKTNQGDKPCSCNKDKGEVKIMDHARKPQIDKLIAAGRFAEADRPSLESVDEKLFKVLAEEPQPKPETVVDEKKEEKDKEKVAAVPVTDTSVVQVPADVYEQMKAAASAYALDQKNKKDTKVAECMRLQGENPVWTKADLDSMELIAVDKIHRSLSAQAKLTGNSTIASPSILARNPQSLAADDPNKVDPMPSVSTRILEKSSGTKTVRGSAEIAANQSTN